MTIFLLHNRFLLNPVLFALAQRSLSWKRLNDIYYEPPPFVVRPRAHSCCVQFFIWSNSMYDDVHVGYLIWLEANDMDGRSEDEIANYDTNSLADWLTSGQRIQRSLFSISFIAINCACKWEWMKWQRQHEKLKWNIYDCFVWCLSHMYTRYWPGQRAVVRIINGVCYTNCRAELCRKYNNNNGTKRRVQAGGFSN